MATVEGEFIFDAVGGFLTSPIWNYPVRTFIEQNSLVFDPDGENHEAYQEIHKKYKEMVDTLLSSFIKDVGISEEQFMKACQEGRSSPQFNSINRDVFDHMWAAEDYEVFKRLMIQKNIELQLQALQLLQQVHNVQMPMPIPMQNQIPMPVSVAPPNSVPMAPSSSVPPPPGADEDAIMQEVLRRSKEEFESKQKDAKAKTEQEFERTLAESTEESKRLTEIAKREQDELEKALQISLEAQKMQTAEVEKLRDEVKKSTSKGSPQPTSAEAKPAPKPSPAESKAATKAPPAASKTAPKPSPVKSKSPTQPKSQASGLPPLSVKTKKADTPVNAAEGWLKSAKEDAANNASVTPTQSKEVSEEEMKRRAAYLKQQRDKLMDLKRQEREKNLTKYTEQQPKARPTSSRAARQVTAGEQVPSPAAKSDKDGEKKLAMRRALADVLKREVVDKN